MVVDSLPEARQRAGTMLANFIDPALLAERPARTQALRPHAEDYATVFHADVAEIARQGYEQMVWSQPMVWPIKSEQTRLRVVAALAEDFAVEMNPRAREFPGGYASVASHFMPGHMWFAWEYLAPGASAGLAFDGLVELGDRWAWFPKPWRILPRIQKGEV